MDKEVNPLNWKRGQVTLLYSFMRALNTKKVIPQLLGQIANVGLQEELTVTAEKIK